MKKTLPIIIITIIITLLAITIITPLTKYENSKNNKIMFKYNNEELEVLTLDINYNLEKDEVIFDEKKSAFYNRIY